jgi:hypothetical protein
MFNKFLYSAAATLLLATSVAQAVDYHGVLKAGQQLNPGDRLFSGTKNYMMTLQATDGNLVVYAYPEMHAAWSAGNIAGKGGVAAAMQGDGNFVVYNAAGAALWNSGTGDRPGASLYLSDNSVFYITGDSTNKPVWQSANAQICYSGQYYTFPACIKGMNQSVGACSTIIAASYALANGGQYGPCP